MTTPKYDLPTAIRIGSKIRGQTKAGHYYSHGRSCAIGAAVEAEGNRRPNHLMTNYIIKSTWPELDVFIDDYRTLEGAILFLNDDARWTREEIADWVDMVLP